MRGLVEALGMPRSTISLRKHGASGRQEVETITDTALAGLIDTIGEAALDPGFWPLALTRLADLLGAGQPTIASFDRRTLTFSAIAPRTDPELLASYESYWALRNPLWTRSTAVPVGQTFSIDSLMGREAFAKTPVFNEWWKPARCGLAIISANILMDDGLTTLISIGNGPSRDAMTGTQQRVFELVIPHIRRSVQIQRKFCRLDLEREAAADRLDALPQGVLLVDSGSRIVFANLAAKSLLDSAGGLVLRGSCIETEDGADLRGLIAGCAAGSEPGSMRVRGGELEIARGLGRSPLQVTVAPLYSRGLIAGASWLGLRPPVAVVYVIDPDEERRRFETYMRDTFRLTSDESRMAAEFAEGNGRGAVAQRRAIALSAAGTQLSSIYEKTGTRRPAELVRLVREVVARLRRPGPEPALI